MTMPPLPDPGWHQDPADATRLRWWDGSVWTEHVRAADPAGPPAPGGAHPAGGAPGAVERRPRTWRRRAAAAGLLGVAGLFGLGVLGAALDGGDDDRPTGEHTLAEAAPSTATGPTTPHVRGGSTAPAGSLATPDVPPTATGTGPSAEPAAGRDESGSSRSSDAPSVPASTRVDPRPSDVLATAAPRTSPTATPGRPAKTTSATPTRTARPRPVPVPTAAPEPTEPAGAFFRTCADAWAAGAAPLHRGDPGYRPKLDRDGDGTACETPPGG